MSLYKEDAPEKWIDHLGVEWKTPVIKGSLKFKSPSHVALKKFILHRDGYKCVRCGSTKRIVADHIISRRNGGAHHPQNMQCLCESCNSRKATIEDKFHKGRL